MPMAMNAIEPSTTRKIFPLFSGMTTGSWWVAILVRQNLDRRRDRFAFEKQDANFVIRKRRDQGSSAEVVLCAVFFTQLPARQSAARFGHGHAFKGVCVALNH